MPENSPDQPGKKLVLTPRGLRAEAKTGPDDDGADPVSSEKSPKLTSQLKQTGKPFPARAVTRPKPDHAAPEGDPVSVDKGASVSRGEISKECLESRFRAEPTVTPPEKAVGPDPELGWQTGAPPGPGTGEKKPVQKPRRPRRKLTKRRVRLLPALTVFLVAICLFSWGFFSLGSWFQQQQELSLAEKEGVTLPPEIQEKLDLALFDLRKGDAGKAAGALSELEASHPEISSLTYLVALAAMQSGNIGLAEAKSSESIDKRERISDSLALKAVLETQKSSDPRFAKLGDNRARSEMYLRQAIAADAANPNPVIELASLLRYQNRNDEARRLMESARSRLNPVDSSLVVDVSLALMELQGLPDDKVPADINPQKNVASAFSAAYVAMRNGNLDHAAEILKVLRRDLPEDVFYYLIGDPTLRKFARQPKLAEFFN